MSANVTNIPALVAQETRAWCFAAAEYMARSYRNLTALTQYQIARANVMGLVGAQAPPTYADWNNASAQDLVNPTQDENNGTNLNSQRVQVVRTTYGAVNHTAINGTLSNTCTQNQFSNDINGNKIVLIGSANHYYVVYGYDDTAAYTLRVRDPWPQGQGGQTTMITYNVFNGWPNKVVIRF